MLNTENLLQSLHQLRLPPALIHLVAKWSALCDKSQSELNVAQSSTDLRLALDDRQIELNDAPLLELLRRYALLSSQPVLSEAAAEQISQILELAELDDGLALLLSQVDQALLDSTDLLNPDAQDFYADQTSRILEFLTPSSETNCSKELLNLLLDQCAQSNASFVLSIEDPPDLPLVITPPLSYSKSRPAVRHRSKFLIAAFTTTVATLVTGVAIVGKQCLASLSQFPNLPWEPVTTSPIQLPVPIYPQTVRKQSNSLELQASVSQTALLDRQQPAASQQFQIEQAQLHAEQQQQEAEQKQILAEQQNQYQEAQYWHHQAQRWYQEAQDYLKQSQMLQEKAQEKIIQPQLSLPKLTIAGSASHALRSNDGTTLLASTFITRLLVEWVLFLVLSMLLILSFTALWKREFH